MPAVRIFNPKDVPTSATVEYIVERFFTHATSVKRYSDESALERRRVFDMFIERYGSKAVEHCIPDDLQSWIDSKPEWDSPWTKRHKCQMIQAAFNWGAKMRIIDGNPFFGVVYEEGERRPSIKPAEYQSILRISDPGFRRFLTFLRSVGCRAGEASGLEWPDVDLERGTVKLSKHKTRKKTKKAKIIVLPTVAWKLLSLMRRRCPGHQGHVFLNMRKTAWTKSALDTKWDRLRQRAGVGAHAVIHGIRHLFGSQQVAGGKSLKLVSVAMGHSSVKVTEKFYVELDGEIEAIRAAMETKRR